MITPEQHAEIRRLYYGEHWKVGTIGAALGVHHDTVRAAIADTQAVRRGTCRATTLDPYLPFVRDTLAQFPRLRATRLYEMVRDRGYPGSVVQLRRLVRVIRPQASPVIYRRLTGPRELTAAVTVALARGALGAGAIRTFSKRGGAAAASRRPSHSCYPITPVCAISTSRPIAWRPMMPSVAPIPTTTLIDNLRRVGLTHTADDLNDLVARATQKRWSPVVLLETLVQFELEDRTRRRVERRLRDACLGRFKSITDWDWAWPKQLHRPTVERVFTLDFLGKGENVILVGAQGLGKTMLAKNLVHQAVLAGHSALFLTASDLVLDLNGQETSRALERRLRAYTRPHLLAIDEIGYLAYDAHAADLLFQIVSRRYEQKSLLVTTNLPFKQWDTIFPNASCAVALIDRLTHHAEIIPIEGDSYRRRDAELTHKSRRPPK